MDDIVEGSLGYFGQIQKNILIRVLVGVGIIAFASIMVRCMGE